MTMYAWARRRTFPRLPDAEPRYFDTEPGTRVLAHCHWQPQRLEAPTVVLLHGLEGSSHGHYMRGLAEKAWTRGCNVVRLNHRNCGGTEHLSPTLYHSGLTADLRAVLRELHDTDKLTRIGLAGYSMGGNIALKLMGEATPAPGAAKDALPMVRAVCAVSPPIDLAACMTAMESLDNRLYEWNFLRTLRARLRRKAALFPARYPTSHLQRTWSIRRFDDVYTSQGFGYRDAADYYHRCSALRVIDRITCPTLILTAADDPFVPAAMFGAPALQDNPHISLCITTHGGHCGFVERAGDDDGYYAERVAIGFLVEQLGRA
jgi:predicted alpha/beta-fold hydrolase